MSSRVSHAAAYVRMSFLSNTESSCIACRDHALFILSSTDGRLGCAPVLFIFLENPFESKVVERRISIRFASTWTSQEASTSGRTESRKMQRDRESSPRGLHGKGPKLPWLQDARRKGIGCRWVRGMSTEWGKALTGARLSAEGRKGRWNMSRKVATLLLLVKKKQATGRRWWSVHRTCYIIFRTQCKAKKQKEMQLKGTKKQSVFLCYLMLFIVYLLCYLILANLLLNIVNKEK